MNVLPLTIDRVDWQTWNTLRRKHNRDPITRALDRVGMKPEHPLALLQVLDDPRDHILRICNVGFLITPDEEIAPHTLSGWLQAECEFPLVATDDGVIVKGSFYYMREFVLRGSSEVSRPAVRVACNLIFETLQRGGFKLLFEGYKRRSITDGTFVLCEQ